MTRLVLKLFGEPLLHVAGETRPLKVPRRTWPLVALLALNERPWSRASLAALLWPDEQEARAALRRHLHGLAAVLPDPDRWLIADTQTIGWNHEAPCSVDAVEFMRAIAEKRLSDAVELYSGDLLGVLFDEAILEERERLRELYFDALAASIERMRAERNFSAAVRYAETLLAADEFREDVVRDLMRARYEDGDRSGAIATYERFAKLLHAELHAHPMAETSALRDAIISGNLPDQTVTANDTGPFVGRARELAELKTAWNRAVRGNVAAVFLSGEAGIGKSRLANEFCAAIAEQNACVLRGSTSSPEAAPFEAIVEALEDNVSLVPREELDDASWGVLTTIMPCIAALHPTLPQAQESDPDGARVRLRDAIARLLVAAAARRPVAMLLEDLHWAGGESIELLDAVIRRAIGAPVLLLVTYRTEDRSGRRQLDAMRRRYVGDRKAVNVALGRLRDAEISEIATRIVARSDSAAQACDRIAAIASGHPLFAIQLARYYADSGVLPGETEPLDNVAEAVARRCERLPEDARTLVQIAALFESAFTIEELASASGWDESRALDALGMLLDAKLVGERGGGRFAYAFTHALIESAVRELVDPSSIRGRRRRIAAVLEETRAGDAGAAGLIAAHWEAAGEMGPAARAHLRAARVAKERYAYREAIDHANRALGLELDDEQRFEALIALVRARQRIGDYTQGFSELDELDELAARLGPEREFEVHWLRNTIVWTEPVRFERAVEQLYEFAVRSGRKDWIAQAEFARAHAVIRKGNFTAAVEVLQRLHRAAREESNDRVRYYSSFLLIQVLYFCGDFEAGLALTAELEEEFERTGLFHVLVPVAVGYHKYANLTEFVDEAITAKARHYLARLAAEHEQTYTVLMGRCELAEEARIGWDVLTARSEYKECIRIAREMAVSEPESYAMEKLGELEIAVGHFDRALEILAQASAICKVRGTEYALLSTCEIQTAQAQLALGRPKDALANARAALARVASLTDPYVLSAALFTLGAAEFATGDYPNGLEHMREGIERRRPLRTPIVLNHELGVYLDALLAAGKEAQAQAIAAELAAAFVSAPNRQRAPGFLAAVLARAAEHRGDSADAGRVRALGRRALDYVTARLTNADDKRAFSELCVNAEMRSRI